MKGIKKNIAGRGLQKYKLTHFKCDPAHVVTIAGILPLSKKLVDTGEKVNEWYEKNKKFSSTQKVQDRNPKYIIQPNLAGDSIEDKFMSIAKMWKRETMMSSLVAEKITNLNYQTIIGLGMTYKEKILYLILKDLEQEQEYWHYALKSITGENPVPKGMVNNLDVVRQSWLQWARENNKI
jgi:hypothetical protein